jgi:MFS family permease
VRPLPSSRLPFHYGWVVVAAGTLSIFACLGLGRFALGMLLPSMGPALGLSYAQMGSISTANFLGYLVAVLGSGYLVRRISPRKLIFLALLLVGFSMALVGKAGGFLTVLVLYLLTGVGSGAANVPMMGLVTAWFGRKSRGRAAGFIVSGSGFAIILSGWMIPAINSLRGAEGWRVSWLVSGMIVAAAAVICFAFLRDTPAELGLRRVDEGPPSGEGPSPGDSQTRDLSPWTVLHLGAIYFVFGFTYVIYATFIVTFLVREHGYPEGVAGTFWSAVGLLSLFSGPVFGSLSDRWGRKSGLMLVFTIQMFSYLLAATGKGGILLYLSVGLFGIVAWSIPSIMAALAGDYAGPLRAAEVFGLITFIFGIGQTAGPALAGILADATGSFRSSFALAASLALGAVILTALLKGPPARRTSATST